MVFHINHKRIKRDIDPDEIFLDSRNLPHFNTQQFEGRLEKPIPKRSIFILAIFFIIFFIIFIGKLSFLQIINGEEYFTKSENNILRKEPIISPRGLIYDRNDILLAWNTWDDSDIENILPPKRSYINSTGFGLLLGYLSTPAKDSKGNYWRDTYIGKAGVEKYYNKFLSGINGAKIIETNVRGQIQSENTLSKPISGSNLKLSIDSRIQKKMYDSIATMARNVNFTGGSGIIMDIKTGELIAITSYPEYNSEIISYGKDTKTINRYLTDKRKVFMNRSISGLYAPGSIVKPFIGYAALTEKIISPFKLILANGSISIPNSYFPDKKSIFKDHASFGYVNLTKAIAISSDVYFYEIGGGYKDQKGLGISKINKYMSMFGISKKTEIDLNNEKSGVIPNPEWKAKNFKGDIWRVGDTYNSSIGQYGFQVTPIQMAKAIAIIANDGLMPIPHIKLDDTNGLFKKQEKSIPIDINNMKIIKKAMRMAVTEGTARALNLSSVKVVAKSGTAQVGYGNTNTNSWIIGFFPYEKPRYSFVVLMERGPKEASGNSTYIMSKVLNYMNTYTPEYLK